MTSESDVPRLRLTKGKARRTVVELRGRVTLGRVGSVEVPLADAKASREHARVFEQGGEWHVVDLNSTNGTFVNGAKVTRRVLRPGDEITIGTTSFVFEPPAPAAQETAGPPEVEEVGVRGPTTPSPAPRKPSAPSTWQAGPSRAAPEAPAEEGLRPEDIVVKQRDLHYHRIEGKREVNPLMQDVEQRGGLFKLLVYAGVLALAVLLFILALTVTSSMFSGDDEPAGPPPYEQDE